MCLCASVSVLLERTPSSGLFCSSASWFVLDCVFTVVTQLCHDFMPKTSAYGQHTADGGGHYLIRLVAMLIVREVTSRCLVSSNPSETVAKQFPHLSDHSATLMKEKKKTKKTRLRAAALKSR